MCGLALLRHNASDEATLARRMGAMMRAMQHRGPDDAGMEMVAPQHLALGHQRLAIIDPVHGKQPMQTQDGALTIIFNGALYN